MGKTGVICKKTVPAVLAAAAVIAFYAFAGCPIRLLTGISCFGCGMTRAWLRVLSFDFAGAFRFHPLWPVPLAVIVLYIRLHAKNRKAFNAVLYIVFLLFAVTYAIRIYLRSPVVVIQPEEGLIVRIADMIRDGQVFCSDD